MNRQHKCLVITLDGVPIARVSPERAVIAVMQGKAYVIQPQEGLYFRSQHHKVEVPAIIGLTNWYKLPQHYYKHARLTVNTLLRRDNWTCQYCARNKNKLKNNEFFTRDHIFPVSRGGEDIWENVALACNACNNTKGDRTPDEANMTLLREPFAPTKWQLNRRYVREAIATNNTTLMEFIDDEELEVVRGEI